MREIMNGKVSSSWFLGEDLSSDIAVLLREIISLDCSISSMRTSILWKSPKRGDKN